MNEDFIPEQYCGDVTILTENAVIAEIKPLDFAIMTPDEVIDNYRLTFFEPNHLHHCYTDKRFSDAQPFNYRDALLKRVATGEFKAVIRVADPDGTLIAGPFTDESEIPESLPNRFHSYYYPLEDCTLVHGFEKVKK